jgi:hypothetical protein
MNDIPALDARAALEAAVERRRAADQAEADLLAIAAHWADLHPAVPDEAAACWRLGPAALVGGCERLVPLAGEGTPEVAEFAPGELGAALHISSHAASQLVGDALELRHRLPRLWARVHAGRLQAWRARQVADQTKSLSPAAAAFVDAQVAPVAHKVGLQRVLSLVEVAVRRFDPDEAVRREEARADTRRVWVSDVMTHGTLSVTIAADAVDVQMFDERLDEIADALGGLGDQDRKDVRRAKAVGVIADPQDTLDLLAGSEGASAGGQRGGRPRATLYVHLSQAALAARSGTARVENLGPASLDLVRRWLQRRDVAVRPVLDLDDRVAVDAYEIPDTMRETVLLRSPCCPFPWCANLSRRKDMDHIEPFVPPDEGGPPGQTAAHLLGAPCRRHHRYKTPGGWTYSMPEPGIYLWRSPLGRRYLVDHTGTASLDRSA